jgi:flavin-dependent dehydrogenase
MTKKSNVLIIGAGPSGTSAGKLLAEKGHKVMIVEREKFPRYHIGESLLPFTFEPLKRLGLIDTMKKSAFVKKYSVQFVSPSGKASVPFYFFNRYDRQTVAQTWQVLRSEFDQMLLDHARAAGAEIYEETTVKEFIRDGSRITGARAIKADGTQVIFLADIVLDCSGKESFGSVRNNWRLKDPYLNKVAVWTYYEGALRDEGIDEGATTVAMIPGKGWFWYIPQHNNRVSVGVVAEGKYLTRGGVKSPEEIFKREIEENAWIKQHLAPGKVADQYYLTSEYSHHSRYSACEGLLLVGDAYAFLDPVFSSGVMLALKTGVLAADAVHEALVERDFSPARFAGYSTAVRQGVENMRKLVYAFYEEKFSFAEVIERHPEAGGMITDCLSGDVNKDFTQLWKWISEFVPLPEDMPVGQPLTDSPELASV